MREMQELSMRMEHPWVLLPSWGSCFGFSLRSTWRWPLSAHCLARKDSFPAAGVEEANGILMQAGEWKVERILTAARRQFETRVVQSVTFFCCATLSLSLSLGLVAVLLFVCQQLVDAVYDEFRSFDSLGNSSPSRPWRWHWEWARMLLLLSLLF